MSYLFLLLSILLEAGATACLKLSEGFTKPLYAVATCVIYAICFYLLSLSLRTIPLGVAYAVWAGLGLVLSNVVAVVFFKQSFDLAAALGIGLVLVGVVVLNLFSSASAH